MNGSSVSGRGVVITHGDAYSNDKENHSGGHVHKTKSSEKKRGIRKGHEGNESTVVDLYPNVANRR